MKQILASVIVQGFNQEVTFCEKPVSCDGAVAAGLTWMVPVIESGILKGYRDVVLPTKPTPDSIRVIKVYQGGQQVLIAVADNATLATFADACNLCCDNGTPTIDAPTIIGPFIEDIVCADDDGNFIYRANIPVLVAGQKLDLELVTCNAEALTTPPSSGFANAAALLSWANTNLGAAAGTFSIETNTHGDFLKLVSPECASGALAIKLLKQKWCTGSLTFPLEYNKITTNGVTTTLPEKKTATTTTELIGQVASYFADGLLTSPISGKIQYEGTGAPATLKMDATTKATFTVGACA